MLSFLFVVCYVLYAYGDGFSDGMFKLLGTEIHWTKWSPRLGVIGMILISQFLIVNPYLLLLGMILSFKPLFDFGWTHGNGKDMRIYIGNTDFTDKLLVKWGLVEMEYKRFPIITAIYLTGIFTGLMLILESFKA